jgi:peptide/nickel transport system substrate-binding protein
MLRRPIFIIAVLALIACRRETPAPVTPPPAPAAQQPVEGGRLTRRLESNVETLNYVLHTTDDERQVLAYVYDPLVEVDQELRPIPGLAARWLISDDLTTYTLYLDPRATFSDGQPVRASDVVFTINKILDEGSPQFSSWFENLDREKTVTVGDRAVRFVFKEPRAGQIYAFNLGVMPAHVYEKGNFERNNRVIGTGPYVLARRQKNAITLKRRADYWREKPLIDEVVFRPIADGAVAWRAMQRGDVDLTRIDNDLWARVHDDPAVKKSMEFHDVWELGYNCIVWNLTAPPLDDVRVRRALAMMFNRQAVIDALYHGQARAVSGPFTSDQWANNPEIVPIEFNPGAAQALLASAGWSDSNRDGTMDRGGDPFALELLVIAGSESSREQAQVFQADLARIGVPLSIVPLDDAAFFDRLMKRNYQAASLAWANDLDPDPHGQFHSTQIPPDGFNIAGYVSAEADDLIEEARAEKDPARRADLYHQLHEVLARDQPYLWLVQVSSKWAVNKRVRDVETAKGLGLFLWYPGPHAWWLADEVRKP